MNKKDFMLCKSITRKESLKLDKNIWKSNIKYDGERCIAILKNKEVFMVNRNGKIINKHFGEIEADLKELAKRGDYIFDGEVITYDDDFTKLQRRALTTNPIKINALMKEIPVLYMIFDILQTPTCELRFRKLKSRINFLKEIDFEGFKSLGFVAYEEVNACLKEAEQSNSEGIIIKNMDSQYENRRSNNWLKLKFFKETSLRVVQYLDNNAGVRCEDKEGNAVQIQSKNGLIVKDKIIQKGYCDVVVQYLEKTKNNRLRFISFKRLK